MHLLDGYLIRCSTTSDIDYVVLLIQIRGQTSAFTFDVNSELSRIDQDSRYINDLGGYGGPKRVLMASFSALYDPANHQVNRVTVVYPQSFAEI